MADWTLEQVAARFAEAADVLAPADMRPEFSDLVWPDTGADAAATAVALGDQPDGGDDHLVTLSQA